MGWPPYFIPVFKPLPTSRFTNTGYFLLIPAPKSKKNRNFAPAKRKPLPCFMGDFRRPQHNNYTLNQAIMVQKTFNVSGMRCPNCKAKVEDALRGVAGVQLVEANLAEANVTVTYDDTLVKPQMLKDAVDLLGRFELSL